jgi:DNA-binding transcriptional MerR regulator
VSDFLTQKAWAERLGVSARTFRRWRAEGRIPAPDVNLPGRPRWTVKAVEQTMRRFKVSQRGFQSHAARFQHSERSLHHAGVSQQAIRDVHARQSDESADVTLRNSIVSERA